MIVVGWLGVVMVGGLVVLGALVVLLAGLWNPVLREMERLYGLRK